MKLALRALSVAFVAMQVALILFAGANPLWLIVNLVATWVTFDATADW